MKTSKYSLLPRFRGECLGDREDSILEFFIKKKDAILFKQV